MIATEIKKDIFFNIMQTYYSRTTVTYIQHFKRKLISYMTICVTVQVIKGNVVVYLEMSQ